MAVRTYTSTELYNLLKPHVDFGSDPDLVGMKLNLKPTDKPNKSRLTITRMYEVPTVRDKYKSIAGVIKEALGDDVADIDDVDNISYRGCESCDYGSQYGWNVVITWKV